jgi:3-dehydroquinate synthase
MSLLKISTKDISYPIYINDGLRYEISTLLEKHTIEYDSVLIITDDNVAALYLDEVARSFQSPVHTIIVKAGEAAKSFSNYIKIQTFAIEKRLTRQSLIVALGGGVIGDLAGFIAATYLRGVRYIQMPTTILAHDSAVGGKVAINHELGKNLIGAFHQPSMVLYDLETLKTLPRRQLLSGLAEVIKHALIEKDQELLSLVANKGEEELVHNPQFLGDILTHGMKVKAEIVSLDEKEANVRKFLNFGHTLGHAIESESNYRFLHGEAVIIGMLFAIFISEKYFNINLEFQKFKNWFIKLGYETDVPTSLATSKLVERMKVDKKVIANQISMVLLRNLGEPEVISFEAEEITEYLTIFKSE